MSSRNRQHHHHHHHIDVDATVTSQANDPFTWLALRAIAGYRRFVSPLLPPACRFVPSCSEYSYEAVAKYGIIKGGRLAIWRILRCNPFMRGGYDPVP